MERREDDFSEGRLRDLLEKAKPFRRNLTPTEAERRALDVLRRAAVEPSLSLQAKARLAALEIVRQSWTTYVATSGMISTGLDRETFMGLKPGEPIPISPETAEGLPIARGTSDGLDRLQEWMRSNLREAEALEAETERRGIFLDPERLARSKVQTGERGANRMLLTEHVRALLREQFPGWEDGTPFPGANTSELRGALRAKLMALVGSTQAGVDSGAVLLDLWKTSTPGEAARSTTSSTT